MFTKHDSRNYFPWHHGIMTNLVKLIQREQVERWTSTFHGGRAPEVHCYATPIYNLEKCRLMDEFSWYLSWLSWNHLKFYEIHILGFHVVVLVKEDLSIDVSITNVGLISTKLKWFQLVSTLSIDVSITNVGLILTKLSWFQLFITSQNSNFGHFRKKVQFFGFPWCSTREDLSIDVSITNVVLILTKLRWFQLFVTCQNSNFELFWKKIIFLGFHGAVLVKTYPLIYQLLM